MGNTYKISVDDLNNIHKKLRRARYFYYELSEYSGFTDYEYDMLEKRYIESVMN